MRGFCGAFWRSPMRSPAWTARRRPAGMDRQTLRDWILRYNAHGLEGLRDRWSKGRPGGLSQKSRPNSPPSFFAAPILRRRALEDLARISQDRFSKSFHPASMSRVVRRLGFSRQKARPSHPKKGQARRRQAALPPNAGNCQSRHDHGRGERANERSGPFMMRSRVCPARRRLPWPVTRRQTPFPLPARIENVSVAPLMQHRENDDIIIFGREVNGIGKAAHERPAKQPVNLGKTSGMRGGLLEYGVGFGEKCGSEPRLARLVTIPSRRGHRPALPGGSATSFARGIAEFCFDVSPSARGRRIVPMRREACIEFVAVPVRNSQLLRLIRER